MQFSKNIMFFYKIAPNCVKLILLVSRNYHYASTSHHSFSLLSIYFVIKTNPTKVGNGGDEEIRTPDPLLARQVLSQLSYAPM